MLAAYTFGQVMWSMLVFFAWILFFWMLFAVFGDLFGRHDISGWGKAAWTILVICLPFLGIFIYLIVEGRSMGERSMRNAQAQRAQMDDYIRSTAGSGGGASTEISQAKQLLDSGAITQAEFDQLKAKVLAG